MLNGSKWKELPVIASFDSQGHVKLLYLRINGERYEVLTCTDQGALGTYHVYDVTVENYGRTVPVHLAFWPDKLVWCYSIDCI